uniref:Cyclin N-terminal domain-containing protein n=1 Tax=Panagrolaimus sp. JU765 TaxID=591449 RepID=A0AC34R8T6_9BILA
MFADREARQIAAAFASDERTTIPPNEIPFPNIMPDPLSTSCVSCPSMLNTDDMGSPKKVWSVLCAQDESVKREWSPVKHTKITFIMRTMVIDWMAEVCADRKLHRETFHLSVDYFDRFLSYSHGIESIQLQLIGTAALIIAAKTEEIYPPRIAEICEYTDGGVDVKEAIAMELIMMEKLGFNLNPVTGVHWLALYCQLLAKAVRDEPQILKRHSAPQRLNFDFEEKENGALFLHEKSFLQSIDGVTAFDSSFNDSMNLRDINMSYSEGHLIVNQTTVPKMMREGFCCLAKALDLVITSEYFLKYRYGELAAAVLFCSYEPTSLIEQVTGKKRSDLVEIIDLVQFFVDYCEKTGTVLQNRFNIPGVPFDDQHNIQTYDGPINEHLDYITEQIKLNRQKLKVIHKSIRKGKSSRQVNVCVVD